MLGRKTYSADEMRRGRELVETHLAAFRAVAGAAPAGEALSALEERTAAAALLVLDRAFVHRLRAVEGKDTNPLTEVGLVAVSLVEHDGVMTPVKGIKYVPGSSVLGLAAGDRIRLTVGDTEKLARAFLAELETRFAEA